MTICDDFSVSRVMRALSGDGKRMRWIRAHLDYPHEQSCLIWPFGVSEGTRLAEQLADVVMMLDAPDAYARHYVAAVCRGILSALAPGNAQSTGAAELDYIRRVIIENAERVDDIVFDTAGQEQNGGILGIKAVAEQAAVSLRAVADRLRALEPGNAGAVEAIRPHLIDNDAGEITVTLNDKELRGWSYKDDTERRTKMLAAREYIEGWYDGREAR